MAISYVGGTNGGLAGTAGANYAVSLSGTLAGGSGSSPIAGDIVIVWAGHSDTASVAPTVTGNNNGAYTGAVAASYGNSTRDINARMFYKIMGGTVDTSLTITRTASATFGASAIVQVWRDVDSSTPLDVAGTAATSTTGNSDPPSILPVTAGAVVIWGGAAAVSAANTNPSQNIDTDTIFDTVQNAGSGSRANVFMAARSWTSGAVNPNPQTMVSVTSGDAWASQTIALRPSSGAPPANTNNFFYFFN